MKEGQRGTRDGCLQRKEIDMGLVDNIKRDVQKSGSNKSKFVFCKEGTKVRVRFLSDMEEGMEVKFHDSFEKGVNVPCQEIFGRGCDYCEDEELRTRSQYAWSVWDYEAKEVKLFMFPVNNCSPIPALMAMYETYGTITDRDYVISVSGKQQNKTFSVVPMDKQKFRNEKAKALSEKKILSILDKAYPADSSKKGDDDEDEDEPISEYEGMSPKELYALCVKNGIECEKKKNAKYYITLLEEYDQAQEDWEDDDEDDDDDWE